MKIFKSKNIFQWGPIDGAPLPIHYSALPSISHMYTDLGIGWPLTILTFKGDKMAWFNDQDLLNSIGKKIIKTHILKNENKKKIDALWNARIKSISEFGKHIEKFNLTELPDTGLIKKFEEFNNIYFNFWSIGMLAELVNYGAEDFLRVRLKSKRISNIEDNMAQLCSPTFLSFYSKEEIDLLSIMNEKKINNPNQLRISLKNTKCLNNHIRKYFFILNNYYQTKILDEKYFMAKIKDLLGKNIDPKRKINDILDHIKSTDKNKKKLIKKLCLDKKTKDYIAIIDEFMEFQDIRKYYNLYADYILDVILNEVRKRRKINVQDLKYLLPEEIIQFINGKTLTENIRTRKKLCVIRYDKKKCQILGWKEARYVYHSLFPKNIKKSLNEIKGTIANKGITRGFVKILPSVKDIDKLNEGDILVTTMTSPEFIVAIKKCSAIVTDVGGLTSHAAVVSREFKKPCIINTKIATKVLKDNNFVEVNANIGIIRLLK